MMLQQPLFSNLDTNESPDSNDSQIYAHTLPDPYKRTTVSNFIQMKSDDSAQRTETA